MTEANVVRLGDLLGPSGAAGLAKAMAESGGRHAGLAGAGTLIRGAIASALKPALDIDLITLLADGWRTVDEIRALRRPDPANPGAVTIVKLGKHSITREIKPVIHVRLGADTRIPLDIVIALTGTFEGIELSIGSGAILAVGSGTCDLTAAVALAGQPSSDPATLTAWKLPGEHRFAPPVAIP